MTLCDYFSAADDQAALAVAGRAGGPAEAAFDVVFLKNIDPAVAIAQLEAILTDCTYEEASRRPRAGQLLSSPEDEGRFIISVSDTLAEALAEATRADLVRVAEPWSMTAELQQSKVDAFNALDVLEALAGLAQRAQAADMHLYCWWSI
nr:GE004856 [Streptomyces sp.]